MARDERQADERDGATTQARAWIGAPVPRFELHAASTRRPEAGARRRARSLSRKPLPQMRLAVGRREGPHVASGLRRVDAAREMPKRLRVVDIVPHRQGDDLETEFRRASSVWANTRSVLQSISANRRRCGLEMPKNVVAAVIGRPDHDPVYARRQARARSRTRYAVGRSGVSALSTQAEAQPAASMPSMPANRHSPKFGKAAGIRPGGCLGEIFEERFLADRAIGSKAADRRCCAKLPRYWRKTSLRKTVLRAAASSKVSGGTRRVLVRPGTEAFAMTAMPQAAFALDELGSSSSFPCRRRPGSTHLRRHRHRVKRSALRSLGRREASSKTRETRSDANPRKFGFHIPLNQL